MCRGLGNVGRLPGVGSAIADKITTLCGPVHPAQTTAVFYALSQSGLSALQRGFVPYGIDTDEHSPVTYTLARNNETGDIAVHYSEPEGFPIHFSWQTTIHLDSSSDSTPLTYMLLMQGGTGVDLQFAKDPEGNIRLTVTSRTNAQMLVFNHDDGNNQEQHKLPADSTHSYKLTITLPVDNLDELAEADWAHYDRKAVTNFDGPIDARVNLIPPACRFKGTADLVFHLHEAPAPAP